MPVLDVGSGSEPRHRRNWFNLPGESIAIDIQRGSADMLADAQKLPFQKGAFNRVSMSEVLEHIANPVQALEETYRVLQKHGTFYLTVPNWDWLPVRINLMREKYFHKEMSRHPEHVNNWNYSEVSKLVVLSGYRIRYHGFFTRIVQKGWLPKLAYLLRKCLPSIMEMNIMVIARK